MSTLNRRSSLSSSTASSLAKRQASSSENGVTVTAMLKKRPPLGNLTNLKNTYNNGRKSLPSSATIVPCSAKVAKAKKDSSTSARGSSSNIVPASINVKPRLIPSCTETSFLRSKDGNISRIAPPPSSFPCSMDVSPRRSDDGKSVSLDESMSTCDSFKSPEVEYMDNDAVEGVDTIERKTFSILSISEPAGSICNRDVLLDKETDDKFVDVDDDLKDPQLCATIACDIYKHLRASEALKKPSMDFMERIQKDINASMRAILIDWLVEVAEEYRLVPDTLYLTVNYVDRYLSGNVMNRQRLQLLGVACMMIAAKYEEICAPQVEEFCYITDNTYFKEEVLQMESAVLNYLKFEMTAPTAKCFLRRFLRAAQGMNELPSLQLECTANYIAELSLLEYGMLRYAPSLIAASAIFLAKLVFLPTKRPWTRTLTHYTQYRPSSLRECVKELHALCCGNSNSSLPAIREKYSQHKYKYVAKKCFPPSIPPEFFRDVYDG